MSFADINYNSLAFQYACTCAVGLVLAFALTEVVERIRERRRKRAEDMARVEELVSRWAAMKRHERDALGRFKRHKGEYARFKLDL